MRRAALTLGLMSVAALAFAHSAPNSLVRLDFQAHTVRAEIMIPESELAFATAAEHASQSFSAYLLRHVAVETPAGVPWKVEVLGVRSTTYFDHAYLLADVALTPPAGASAAHFVLVDDAVTHEVRNHVVMVLTRGKENTELLGALQYPARRLNIERR
jgi:hypothetical protein